MSSNLELAHKILDISKQEDFPNGDITNNNILFDSINNLYKGKLVLREQGVLSGLDLVKTIYQTYNSSIDFTSSYKDGDSLQKGTIVFEVSGPLGDLLTLERSVLNTIGLMIAIATNTKKYVQKLSKTDVKIYDTRKTFPGLRHLSKIAVRHGGGYNHRMSLSDAVLIKENHLRYLNLKSLMERLNRVKNAGFVELEVDSLNFLDKILSLQANLDIIMLDNFTPKEIETAVKKINKKYEVEVSGGITLENISDYALKGVNRIAIGALTHSVSYPNISFLVE